MFHAWDAGLSFCHFIINMYIIHLLTAGSAGPRWGTKTTGEQEESHCSETSQGRVKNQVGRGPAGQKTHRCTNRYISGHLQNVCNTLNSFWVCLLSTKAVSFCSWPSENYLEELGDIIVATDIECQTDAFLDRAASPLFIPAKSGKDVETQIEEGEVGNPSGRSGHTLHT